MNDISPLRLPLDDKVLAAKAAAERRYRETVPGLAGAWNATLGVLMAHRSVRAFTPGALPAGTLESLIAAAQSAPSSSNVQAWSVISVEDASIRARLAEIAGNQKHIREAAIFLVFVADLSRVQRLADREGLSTDGLDYTESFLIASLDAAFAAQNALVAAESLGLGTVYIGALRNDAEAVADVLKLPPRAYAVVGLAIGRPDPNVATDVKPRLPQAAILHRNTYAAGGEEAVLARADAHALAFRKEQGLDATPWTHLALQRLHSAASLKGRHALRRQLEKLGLGLK